MQTNTTMRSRIGMDKALMKSISRRELTPEPHRVTNITTRNIGTRLRSHDAITLHPETIRTRAFVFLFPVNGEMSARCWLRRNPDTTRYCHQAAITLHYIDVLFRQRDLHCHLRRIVRLVCGYVVCTAANRCCFATG